MPVVRILSVIIALTFIASSVAEAGQPASKKKNWKSDPNATQADLNGGSNSDYTTADAKLNRMYRQILAKNKSDKLFLDKFIKAEKAWIVFRDAEVAARFPHDSSDYGSVLPMCMSTELTNLTESRIAELKPWIDGIEEGDVCAGSYPVK